MLFLNDLAVQGRMLNAGQACIAPEYILVHRSVQTQLVDELKKTIKDFYGQDSQTMKTNPDIGRIVNNRHFLRVKRLLDEGDVRSKIEFGGETDESENYVEPTIIVDPSNDCPLMKVGHN